VDALRGIGHACGHNLIAIAGMAAAIATVRLLESSQTPGKVVLLGTPAEEAYGGKSYLLKAGAYEGMAACLMYAHQGCDPRSSSADCQGPPGWEGPGHGHSYLVLQCRVRGLLQRRKCPRGCESYGAVLIATLRAG